MEIQFRKAGIADIGVLTECRQKQLQDEGPHANIKLAQNISDYYLRALTDGSFTAWVAVCDGRIVSTAGIVFYQKPPYYSNISGNIGEVCNVFTEREYRRKGLAKSLLTHIANEALSRNITVLRVSASKMGEGLYKSLGFTKADNFYTRHIPSV